MNIFGWLHKILLYIKPNNQKYTSRTLPNNQAYACPKCECAMQPDKSWDVLHCWPCQLSVDLWYDQTPKIILCNHTINPLEVVYTKIKVK